MPGRLIGVGVGPGDPDLITVKARDVLRDADTVFVPVSRDAGDEPGYAERIVLEHLPHATRLVRLAFAVTDDQAERDASWRAAAEEVAEALATGATAAFATIGDPNVYSTFTHLAREVVLRVDDVEVTTVPGITAMQDLAARSGTVLVEREEGLVLLPFTAERERVASALASGASVVLYKGGRMLPELGGLLVDHGRASTAVLGARLGLDGEHVGRLADHADEPAPYLSTVIVPAERDR